MATGAEPQTMSDRVDVDEAAARYQGACAIYSALTTRARVTPVFLPRNIRLRAFGRPSRRFAQPHRPRRKLDGDLGDAIRARLARLSDVEIVFEIDAHSALSSLFSRF